MARRSNPSFLKRQKEQQRASRALAKRQAKQARRENRAAESKVEDGIEDIAMVEPVDQDSEPDDRPAE